jgi:hypothetical protein
MTTKHESVREAGRREAAEEEALDRKREQRQAQRDYDYKVEAAHEREREEERQRDADNQVKAALERGPQEHETFLAKKPREIEPMPVGHLDSINEPGSHAPPLLDEGNGGGTASETPPVITLIDPENCLITDDDFTLTVGGLGFTDASVIHFAGHDEPTTLEEDATLTTGVKPSLWQTEAVVQCSVRNGSVESNIVNFTFNAPATRSRR